MKFSVIHGDVLQHKCGALIVGVFKDKLTKTAEAIDKASEGAVTRWMKAGDISGCFGKCAIFHQMKGVAAERVVFVGLGKDPLEVRFPEALQKAIQAVYMAESVVLTSLEWLPNDDVEWVAEKCGLFAQTALDRPKNYKTHDIKWKTPTQIILYSEDKNTAIGKSFQYGAEIGHGVQQVKNIADMPANLCTPTFMATEAKKIAQEYGLDIQVFDKKELEKLSMGCLLGVTKGSHQEPRMMVLKYQGGKPEDAPIALVGKGLTFDSGGISLKPAKTMDEMKYDMSGAAVMLFTIATAAKLKLPLNIVALVGCTENMPGGNATKPGDILTSYSGQTVEVLNTDAEGRLVLCDLLSYAIDKFKPQCLIDAATLTGACVVALGDIYSGLFCTDDDIGSQFWLASARSFDSCWKLPLHKAYGEAMKSNFADIANVGTTGGAGACTAAEFLASFVGDTQWAHLDIAGTAWKTGKEKGSTGRPLPLLMEFLRIRADQNAPV